MFILIHILANTTKKSLIFTLIASIWLAECNTDPSLKGNGKESRDLMGWRANTTLLLQHSEGRAPNLEPLAVSF